MNRARMGCIAFAAMLGLSLLASFNATGAAPVAAVPVVEVWKSPTCGCCQKWIDGLKAEGFEVKAYNTGNAAARDRFDIPDRLGSCHTARVAGYTLEGHVPVREIRRLLKERPHAVGLAVPRMPRGSPGMEMKDGSRDPYDVLLIEHSGKSTVYQSYRP